MNTLAYIYGTLLIITMGVLLWVLWKNRHLTATSKIYRGIAQDAKTSIPTPSRIKIKQCVNPSYLEILFIELFLEDFKTSFYTEKLKPALLEVTNVVSVRNSSGDGNIYGRVRIEIIDPSETSSVVEDLKPLLQKMFDAQLDVSYEECSFLDYR